MILHTVMHALGIASQCVFAAAGMYALCVIMWHLDEKWDRILAASRGEGGWERDAAPIADPAPVAPVAPVVVIMPESTTMRDAA